MACEPNFQKVTSVATGSQCLGLGPIYLFSLSQSSLSLETLAVLYKRPAKAGEESGGLGEFEAL